MKGQEAVEFIRDQQIYQRAQMLAKREREKRREDDQVEEVRRQAEEKRRPAEREHELTLAHLSGSNKKPKPT